jgi:hypothetical protein
MRCNECRNRLLMGPPESFALPSHDNDVADHLKNCQACAWFAEQQRRVAEGLSHIASETHAPALNEKTEQTLAAAYQRSMTKGRSAPRSVWTGSAPRLTFAIASALCVLVFIVTRVHRDEGSAPQTAQPGQTELEQFMAVPYVVQPAPWERTEVVRMQVSLSALQALGFQVHTAETGGSVTADVLCGQDGRVVAVALLPDYRTTSGERVQE